ncbi:MAG: hypothetical protein FGM50_03675 [Mycobacterium sp.]|nr:hypothetical protein [Mycobacterium sp.]
MVDPNLSSRRRAPLDRAAAVTLSVVATLAGLGSVAFSLFFVMATDSCGPDNCSGSRLVLSYVVTWGGVAMAGVVAIAGMVAAARRGMPLWVWPLLALVLVAATFAAGAALAMSVVR